MGKLLVCVALVGSATGCRTILETQRRGHTASASCAPSQYWDGSQCRHKGKGHGARKHDGAGKAKGK